MKINITARKFKARDTLKEFIEAEVSSLEKFSDEIISVDVILSFQNSKDSIKSAEIIAKVPKQVLSATEETDDFQKSVNAAVEKIARQLKKIKTKKRLVRVK
ncbi:MAG: ribosome-associated translation inhibitor RaiA [Ignavibacteriales bacterium]|nr:MAG: ribosome-associated translation inhibitor RaiA [Ignavibacteriales bacterium]